MRMGVRTPFNIAGRFLVHCVKTGQMQLFFPINTSNCLLCIVENGSARALRSLTKFTTSEKTKSMISLLCEKRNRIDVEVRH